MNDQGQPRDFEQRLRAAMAAVTQPAPSGLLAGIRRRHRRHVLRVRAAQATAAVVVVAGALGTHAALTGPGTGSGGPAATRPAASGPAPTGPAVSFPPAPAVKTAPGTEGRDCADSNGGTVGPGWKAHSVHAGPVWFIDADRGSLASPPAGSPEVTATTRSSAMDIGISNGHTAVVRVAPSVAAHFRFLPSFGNIPSPPANGDYRLSEGLPGLTLGGCAAGPAGTHIPASYVPGVTQFWEGYVTDLRGCVPLEVQAPGYRKLVRVWLPVNGGVCT